MRVDRVKNRPFEFDGIAGAACPFPIEIQALPAIVDRGPNLVPSGIRPQHVNDYPSAVTTGFVARKLYKAIFSNWKMIPLTWDDK